MPNKQTKSGDVAYSSGIILSTSEFGTAFAECVNLKKKNNPVKVDYLHISMSVVTGGYSSDQKTRDEQLRRYNQIINQTSAELYKINNSRIRTGNVRKTSFSSNGITEERIEIEILSPEINKIIQQMEEDIKKIPLDCANKSSGVHITLAGGQGVNSTNTAEWVGLENKEFGLNGAVFSMLDYPPKIAGKTDFSRVVQVTNSPNHHFSPTAEATATPPSSNLPVINNTPYLLSGTTITLDKNLHFDQEKPYYLVQYNTSATARIYLDGTLTNGKATQNLPDQSPLRNQLSRVLQHFFGVELITDLSVPATPAVTASPTTTVGFFQRPKAPAPYVLHDPQGDNTVISVIWNDQEKCVVMNGKNCLGQDRTLKLYVDGKRSGEGVVCSQMYNARHEISAHFRVELPAAHQSQKPSI